MTFAELLMAYMADMTLDQVAALCAERGVNVHPSYLSKLRTGDRPAPDDENLVRALADVCNQDPDPLLLLARIERHPKEALMELLTLQHEVMARTVGESMQAHQTLADLHALVEAGADLDAIKARLARPDEGQADRTGQLLALSRQWFKAQQVLMLARPDAQLSIELPGMQIRRSETELVSDLAMVTDLPADALGQVIKALQTVHRAKADQSSEV